MRQKNRQNVRRRSPLNDVVSTERRSEKNVLMKEGGCESDRRGWLTGGPGGVMSFNVTLRSSTPQNKSSPHGGGHDQVSLWDTTKAGYADRMDQVY